jgi:hypothetical protein
MIVVHPNPKNDAIYQSFLRFQCKCTMFIVATVIFTSCQLVLFFCISQLLCCNTATISFNNCYCGSISTRTGKMIM